jgi:DNA polymerase-3 subunit delta'
MSWDYIGQEWAVRALQKHIARGTTRQAYLFTGPQGVGRRTLALRFARALNCQNPPEPGEECGTCRSCIAITKELQADLSVVRRSQEKTRILIDQVRELQHTLALAPYESKYRVALLVNFQEATEDAQNALLKILEEPPERVILMLTAESAESLLPTISSRCEQIRLRPLKPASLAGELSRVEGLKTAPMEQLAHISEGCPGRAIDLGRSADLYRKRRERIEEGLDLLHQNLVARFAFSEKTSRRNEKMNLNREDLRQMLQAWCGLWRDIYLKLSALDVNISNVDFLDEITRSAEGLKPDQALRCLKELHSGLWKLDNNANLRLLLEVILLGWPILLDQA